MRFLNVSLFIFWMLTPMLQASEKTWLDTFEVGLRKAAEDEKDVLISFMGSDWCEQCKVLKEAVLTKEEFLQKASESFVLVELDYPQGNPKLSERNEPVRAQYGVKGYPVLMLSDSKGKPFGEVRYHREWKTADYLGAIADQLVNKQTRDEARVDFEEAQDDEARTEALEKLLNTVPQSTVSKMYRDEFDALRKSSQDQSPLVQDIAKKERLENMQNGLQTLMGQRRYDEAVKLCDEFLANENMSNHERQAGYTFKFYSLMAVRDFENAVDAATSLREVDPESAIGQQAVGMIQRAKAALAKAESPKKVRPVTPLPDQQKVDEAKGEEPKVAKTTGVSPTVKEAPEKSKASEAPVTSSSHQKSLAALEQAHQALAAAEEALKKAEADLVAARERHKAAHREELAARKMAEKKAAQEQEQGREEPPKTDKGAAQIEAFEKRAAELRKQAEALRKSAEELRKETRK